MTHPATLRVLAASLAAVLVALLTGWLPGDAAAAVPSAGSVRATVLNVTPSTPSKSSTAKKIEVELQLTNTTDEALGSLTVQGVRGNPISNQAALDAAIAHPAPPDPSLAGEFTPTTPVKLALPAGATRIVTYRSTTAMAGVPAGLCLCESRIYPLYFSVHQQAAGGPDVVVGSAQTFIPSFGQTAPHKVQVSWLWPMLERPHRSVYDNVFTDDDLATSVAPGGRLERLLEVVEDVGSQVPMTLLIDPDLIDELAVMAAGKYTVMTGANKTVPGSGTGVASSWLARLRAALDADPGLEIAFTPFADPDVDSLTRNQLSWSVSPSAQAQARVSDALGGREPPADLAWPVNGRASAATLAALVHQGDKAVILDDAALPSSARQSSRPDALAAVPVGSSTATVALTSGQIEKFASDVVTRGGAGTAALPELVSEVAIRAVEDGENSHYVLITPPRDVDPDPAVAATAIRDTARTSWSRPLALRAAVQTVTPLDQGKLSAKGGDTGLPDETIETARYVTQSMPRLTSMVPKAAQLSQLVGSLPDGVQRSESSEWSADPSAGRKLADSLRARVDKVTGGVHLVQPTQGTYTLGSADSPLPITIDNTLAASVAVRISVSTVGGLPGLSAKDLGVQTIDPLSKLPVHIPLHVDRAGRISVRVELMTPNQDPLGSSLVLSVRSTALGNIGKIIMFVAGAVLAGALLVRVLRRGFKRRNGAAGRPQ